MGYTSACLKDEWSLFNNIGGLSAVENTTAAFSYQAYPSLQEFNRMAAVFSTPLKVGVAGIGVFRFGDNLYNEQIISAGYSNKFGLASLGLKVNYVQYQAEGYGSAGVVTVSFGGIATITPQLDVGAHILNINQPIISRLDKSERVPTRLHAGLAFKPSSKLIMCGEVEKQLAYDAIVKWGLEYLFSKKFSLRTGFNINPEAAFFGAGFTPHRFNLNYGFEYDFQIGFNHQAAVTYHFKKR
jgi:hypothetical protein